MISNKDARQLCSLICRVLEGHAQDFEVQSLERQIKNDPDSLELYTLITEIHAQLMCPGLPVASRGKNQDEKLKFDIKLLEMLLADESSAPALDIPEEKIEEIKQIVRISPSRVHKKNSLSSLVYAMAAMLFIAFLIYFNQSPAVPVATVVDSYNANWKTMELTNGERIVCSESSLELFSGLVKLRLDDGAEIIVEGPVSFNIETADKMRLNYGKLAALVPPVAAGFRVDSAIMSVTDLGTEFSIYVDQEGVGTVNLYNGKAVVMSGAEGNRTGTDMLSPGQARVVKPGNCIIESTEFNDVEIVRSFNSSTEFIWHGTNIDLAAIIAGADMFSSVSGINGINIQTGESVSGYEYKSKQSTGKYILAADNKYVDGVFIPDAQFGASCYKFQ